MEPEGSLPHSQVPASCPYPEPARSSPHPHTPLPEDPSKYYPPIYAWVSPVVHLKRLTNYNETHLQTPHPPTGITLLSTITIHGVCDGCT